jgi:Fe-S cluster biogenesis protein NfuA
VKGGESTFDEFENVGGFDVDWSGRCHGCIRRERRILEIVQINIPVIVFVT